LYTNGTSNVEYTGTVPVTVQFPLEVFISKHEEYPKFTGAGSASMNAL
jgi:hypothetical protein